MGISRQRINQIGNPHKHNARVALHYAIKTGKITKPSQCEQCQAQTKIEGHHSDYNRPLEVQWLCKNCHTKSHLTGEQQANTLLAE